MIVHAGCLGLWARGRWRGALVFGPSGVGKSDLALRLIDQGFALVADDRTRLWRSAGRLFGACPQPIEGLVEARGLGLTRHPWLRLVQVDLIVRCGPGTERLPDPRTEDLCGGALPVVTLEPLHASAPAKLRHALASLGQDAQGAYLAAAENPRGGVPVKGRL